MPICHRGRVELPTARKALLSSIHNSFQRSADATGILSTEARRHFDGATAIVGVGATFDAAWCAAAWPVIWRRRIEPNSRAKGLVGRPLHSSQGCGTLPQISGGILCYVLLRYAPYSLPADVCRLRQSAFNQSPRKR